MIENSALPADSSDSTNDLPPLESKVVGGAVGHETKFRYSLYDVLTDTSDSDEVLTEKKSEYEVGDATRPTLQNLDCSGFVYRPFSNPEKIVKSQLQDIAAMSGRKFKPMTRPIYVYKPQKLFEALIPPPIDNTMQLIKTENSDTTNSESKDDATTSSK